MDFVDSQVIFLNQVPMIILETSGWSLLNIPHLSKLAKERQHSCQNLTTISEVFEELTANNKSSEISFVRLKLNWILKNFGKKSNKVLMLSRFSVTCVTW